MAWHTYIEPWLWRQVLLSTTPSWQIQHRVADCPCLNECYAVRHNAGISISSSDPCFSTQACRYQTIDWNVRQQHVMIPWPSKSQIQKKVIIPRLKGIQWCKANPTVYQTEPSSHNLYHEHTQSFRECRGNFPYVESAKGPSVYGKSHSSSLILSDDRPINFQAKGASSVLCGYYYLLVTAVARNG